MKTITRRFFEETGLSAYKHNFFGKRIHNQAYIDWLEKQCVIQRVSQQRELFCDCDEPKPMSKDMYDKTTCITCRKEIEQNCG